MTVVSGPPTMQNLPALRRQVVEVGRRLYERGMIVAGQGNLSARLPNGRILVSPAGFCKGQMRAADLVIVDRSGKRLTGTHPPSSELGLHLTVLSRRRDVAACVHAHPPYATAFAVAGIPLAEAVLPEVVADLCEIPLAPYATPSTPAVGESILPWLDYCNAFLLKNHGVLTLGPDLETAFRRMEMVEHFAQVLSIARLLGHVDTLPSA
jgi:L-fuculose-phosphate aldolase